MGERLVVKPSQRTRENSIVSATLTACSYAERTVKTAKLEFDARTGQFYCLISHMREIYSEEIF